jgi:hypothetical protein
VLVGLLKFGLVSEAAEWVEHTLRRIAEVGHLKSATPGDGLLITPSGREVRLLPTLSFSPSTLGLKSEEAEPLAAWLQHSPAVFGPILARLVDHGVEYRGVATGDLLVACSTLSPTLFAPLATAALRRMSRTVTKAEGRVPGWIGSQTFRLLCSAFSAHPDLLAFFEVCLKGLPEKLDAPRILAVALLALPPVARPVGLRTFATACLTRMIQNPPIKPTNWVRDAAVRCQCQDCGDLRSFMASPKHDSWSFRARQELRSHVERSLVGLDVSTRTLRSGSPHTLIVTKTLASYERSLARLEAAKRALELLKGGQPGELLPALEG